MTALKSDPAWAAFFRPEVATLLWDGTGLRLLWASPPAASFASHLLGPDGLLAADSALGHLLQEVAAAPVTGTPRLARIRLDPVGIQPPATFLCRRVSWPGGEGTLTQIVGAVPRARPRLVPAGPPALPAPASTLPTPAIAELRRSAPAAGALRRFVWRTDAGGRLTELSPDFLALLAPDARVLGRAWPELVGQIVADPDGAIATGLAGRDAWSHARSLWQLAGERILPVQMAGSPVVENGLRRGFRGFGRFQLEDAAPSLLGPAAPAVEGHPDEIVAVPEAGEPVSAEPAPSAPTAAPTPDDAAAGTSASQPVVAQEPATEPADEPGVVVVEVSSLPGPSDAVREAEPVTEPAGSTEAAEAASVDAAVERPSTPPLLPGAPYKTAHALHPMFQAFLDASLSGLSQFIAAMPPGAKDERPGPDHGPAQPAADVPHGVADAAAGEPLPEPGMPDRAVAPAEQEPEGHAAPGFGGLKTQVAAHLGGPPPVPLRLVETGADAVQQDGPAIEPGPVDEERPILSFSERGAFHEIARVLGARLEVAPDPDEAEPRGSADVIQFAQPRPDADALRLLERLPLGILVHRGDILVFANRQLLDMAGYADQRELTAAGGLAALFAAGAAGLRAGHAGRTATLLTRTRQSVTVTVHHGEVDWRDGAAEASAIVEQAGQDPQLRALELELDAGGRRLDEARAVLDLAADGVVMLDESGRVLSLSRAAETLFGYGTGEIAGETLAVLLEPASHKDALAALEAARGATPDRGPIALAGRARDGRTLALRVSFGRIGTGEGAAICAIVRDEAGLRQIEGALAAAKRVSDKADRQAADFLARISHEVRTPLNAIIGFAELMLEERFGPIGTERYKSYLADIRGSGGQVIKLVDDLVDLANAITGRFEVPEQGLDLNQLVAEVVAELQPAAARARIIVRTSFAGALPGLFIDERALRQIAGNILSNAIRFTEPGGQVIASTALMDGGEIALRIRDTGIGMSADEVELALEPFRKVSPTRPEGRGLGLPLAKALVEANRGTLAITSRRGEGTLVEIQFQAMSDAATASPDNGNRRRNA